MIESLTQDNSFVTRQFRQMKNDHSSVIIWFTGLSGSGKSTLSNALEQMLHEQGYGTYRLDGDNCRFGICSDLGFSDYDRQENIRRIGEVAKLMLDAGLVTIVSAISPFKADRDRLRNTLASDDFIEVFCHSSLSVCEARDPKGLYKKARAGEIANFTGIGSAYEAPVEPELILYTDSETPEQSLSKLITYLQQRGFSKLHSL